ncbi:MAG TPA: RNA polymerase sigma factor [Candidatus Cloacimonadota bacterium]|nr:RNA polymerase sigma factor [Candidatus Cloacimonadota bacterium]
MRKERFEEFLATHEKRIFRYLMGITASEHDAMDLVQVVFISVYEHFERIEEATALAYVYKIAHNKAMTFLKQRNRYVTLDPEKFKHLPQLNPESAARDYTILNQALAQLPPRLAAVIQLQYYENMSYKDISAHLGISVKAVESLLVRAKRILRKKMMQESKTREV